MSVDYQLFLFRFDLPYVGSLVQDLSEWIKAVRDAALTAADRVSVILYDIELLYIGLCLFVC